MAVHLPLLLRFTNPQVTWQQVFPPSAVFGLPHLLLGSGKISAILVTFVGATMAFEIWKAIRSRRPLPYRTRDIITVSLSIAAVAIVYGLAFLRPSFTGRYLVPFMPGFLLGLAVWLNAWSRRFTLLPVLVIVPLLLVAAYNSAVRLIDPKLDPRWNFSWQQAATDMRTAGVRHVTFFWDNPTAAIGDPSQLGRVGGFFFDRVGAQVETTPLILAGKGDRDPNPALGDRVRVGDGFIWAYDTLVPHTLAVRHPPRFAGDARWRCRNYGRANVTILGCLRVF
jgi:hypothetical protein